MDSKIKQKTLQSLDNGLLNSGKLSPSSEKPVDASLKVKKENDEKASPEIDASLISHHKIELPGQSGDLRQQEVGQKQDPRGDAISLVTKDSITSKAKVSPKTEDNATITESIKHDIDKEITKGNDLSGRISSKIEDVIARSTEWTSKVPNELRMAKKMSSEGNTSSDGLSLTFKDQDNATEGSASMTHTTLTATSTVPASSPQLSATCVTSHTPDIPENILSPPKSENQTDETNTATSSSPASENDPNSQSSPPTTTTTTTISIETKQGEQQQSPSKISNSNEPVASITTKATTTSTTHLINVVANGTIPKSPGKPLLAAMNKKLNRPTRSRKHKSQVAMYESEISDNKIGIRLCIKKSDTTSSLNLLTPPPLVGTASVAAGATIVELSSSPIIGTGLKAPPPQPSQLVGASKPARKRSRKSKSRPRMDSDDSEYEMKSAKKNSAQQNAERTKKVSFSSEATGKSSSDSVVGVSVEQSVWGERIPEEILYKIFELVIGREGCLPALHRLSRVCSLWRHVALTPSLWHHLDLSSWFKEKHRNELRLKWFVDNRCSACLDLNVANIKVSDINCVLSKISVGCPNLRGITLSGWKELTSEHLAFLVKNLKKLERLDLSSVNVEMSVSRSAVGLQSLSYALQTINERLTHLYLAHNRLAGIPQLVNILAASCPNLVVLDLSNVTTQATSHGILHIEKLQHGCPKLKILRVTNSHLTLGSATMQEMMDSPGFPDLEELSVAVLTDESRIIGDEHLQRIVKTSSKLNLLDVRGCTRLTHESLIRLPAWDIKHLFLSGCSVTRDVGSGLELIASKWAHSLIELDLAWANVQQPLDNALRALAEKASESPLAHLNLCGSSVSDEAVKDILANCAHLSSINLASCRGLPRGVKRLMQGPQEIQELRDVLKVEMRVKLPSEREQNNDTKSACNFDVNVSASHTD